MKNLFRCISMFAALVLVVTSAGVAQGREVAISELPDAPQAQQSASPSVPQGPEPGHRDPQTKRILYIFPNFRAVSSDEHLPPQSPKDKFVTASQDSFDYSALVVPAAVAGEREGTNATPEFGGGGIGYFRYFWHTYTDQTIENYLVEFIVPTATHEDTRYYTLGPRGGGAAKRIGYSLSRVVITRNDQGHDTFNFSEVIGSGAAAGISNLYYPRNERTFSNTATSWGTNVGLDAAAFVIREIWPDVNHMLFHKKGPMEGQP